VLAALSFTGQPCFARGISGAELAGSRALKQAVAMLAATAMALLRAGGGNGNPDT
jgi:hypothetical protein